MTAWRIESLVDVLREVWTEDRCGGRLDFFTDEDVPMVVLYLSDRTVGGPVDLSDFLYGPGRLVRSLDVQVNDLVRFPPLLAA